MMSRSGKMDSIKAIAIALVVLYHMGITPYGYLGVDMFLVISGYLTARSLSKRLDEGCPFVVSFLVSRFARILPLVLCATTVSLALGLVVMLPDDLENLSETVVASNVFLNNVLQCITTGNYWDVVNEYKPLMHTWYLGLLFQYYFVIAILFWAAGRFFPESSRRSIIVCLSGLSVLSWLLLVVGIGKTVWAFYYLPWRFFEFSVGSLVWFSGERLYGLLSRSWRTTATWVALMVCPLMLLESLLIANWLRVTIVVIVVAVLLLSDCERSRLGKLLVNVPLVCSIGRASLSVFIWHQVILAFGRYSIISVDSSALVACAYLAIIILLSMFSYYFIERIDMRHLMSLRGIICMSIIFLLINGVSLVTYLRAGVWHDVPELEIVSSMAQRGMHAKYNSRNHLLDRDFTDTSGKIKVLVVGDSFARDWINVLRESSSADKLQISYCDISFWSTNVLVRACEADFVFYATMGGVNHKF